MDLFQEANKMNNKQPKIKLEWTILDKAVELFGAIALVTIWLFLIYFYPKLPQTIPVHFDAAGKIDGYGNKIVIIFEPIIASILYFGLTFLNRFPHSFNYLSPINDDNAEYQYRLATRLIRYIKLVITLLFIFVMWTSIQATTSQNEGLGIKFLPLFIALIIIPTLYITVKSTKTK